MGGFRLLMLNGAWFPSQMCLCDGSVWHFIHSINRKYIKPSLVTLSCRSNRLRILNTCVFLARKICPAISRSIYLWLLSWLYESVLIFFWIRLAVPTSFHVAWKIFASIYKLWRPVFIIPENLSQIHNQGLPIIYFCFCNFFGLGLFIYYFNPVN